LFICLLLKISRANSSNDSSSNGFVPLDDREVQEQEQKKIKPPPIYIREKTSSALVNKLAAIIRENSSMLHHLLRATYKKRKCRLRISLATDQ